MVRIVLGGDALVSSKNLKNRIDPKIVQVLTSSDVAFLNAEFQTPSPDTPSTYNKNYLTSVTPEIFDDFADLNLRLVSLANNHTTEFGWKGLLETIEEVEKRKLIPVGVGRSLDEAKLPKFFDAPSGRIGVLGASATGSHLALAADGGARVPARAGLLPLRWSPTYILPEQEYNQLDQIDKLLGTRDAMLENGHVEIRTAEVSGENYFKFGHLFDGNLVIQKAEPDEKAHVRTTANKLDVERILTSVKDLTSRSHLPIFTIHTHEGDANNWYNLIPPHFIQKLARQTIDAGAKAFVGHGAHMLRGVEIYKGKPIFYNIGSFIMEFETGQSFIGPEMYLNYGLDPHTSRPSDLHTKRSYGKDGKAIGFRSGRKFSTNILVELEIDGDDDQSFKFKIIPIDLGLDTRKDKLQRGLPQWATPEVGVYIRDYLEESSKPWGTKFHYDDESGYITVASVHS